MRKNVSGQFASAQLTDTSGAPVTGGTTTVYVTGDNGTQTQGTVGSGLAAPKNNGLWTYAPSQAETNFNYVCFTFVNSTGVVVTKEYTAAETFADAMLSFASSSSTGSDSGKHLLNVIRLLFNKFTVSGNILTVYKEDGVTVAFTRTFTADAAAQPIVGGN